MNRKVFNIKLYLDELKQLRLIGVILGSLTLIGSLLIPILDYTGRKYLDDYTPPAPDAVSSLPIMMIFVFIAGIVMTFSAFSFLNSRKASDQYHSLPSTRTCMFISILAAVLSWIIVTIIITSLLTRLTYAAFGMAFNSTLLPYLILAYTVSAIIIVAATALAMSLTGTFISNLLLAVLILFLPRLIIHLFATMITFIAPIVTISDLGLFAGPSINIPFSFASALPFMDTIAMSKSLISPASIIYTGAVGLIYSLLACLCFRRRKSEAAGKSSQSRIMQAIYRSAVTIPFLLPATYMLYRAHLHTDYPLIAIADPRLLIILIIASLFSYFVFELLTTKKAKNMLRAAPWFLIPVAFCILFLVGVNIGGNAVLNAKVDMDKIAYITIDEPFSNVTSNIEDAMIINDFIVNKQVGIKLDNKQIKEILIKSLDRNVNNVKANRNNAGFFSIFHSFTFVLENGKKVRRNIGLMTNDSNRIMEIIKQNPEYMARIRILPNSSEITNVEISGLDSEQSREVWKLFQEEAENLSDQEFRRIIDPNMMLIEAYSTYSYDEWMIPYPIQVSGFRGKDSFISSYNISGKMHKTLNLYFNYNYDLNIEDMRKAIEKVSGGEQSLKSLYIDIHNAGDEKENPISIFYDPLSYGRHFESGAGMVMVGDMLSQNEANAVIDIIAMSGLRKALAWDIVASIYISPISAEESGGINIYLSLTQDELDAILEIIGQND